MLEGFKYITIRDVINDFQLLYATYMFVLTTYQNEGVFNVSTHKSFMSSINVAFVLAF